MGCGPWRHVLPGDWPQLRVLCWDWMGLPYPVTKDTQCAGSGSVVCKNPQGNEFLCVANNTCCGGTCVAPGGVCCQNQQGNFFPCGKGSRCGTNVCIAAPKWPWSPF